MIYVAHYVISDIHGCFDEFRQMLDKIEFSDEDRLYLAGDYIDRGPKSIEMLRWLEMCPQNVFPIKGNHDAEFAENVKIMRQVNDSEELNTDQDSNEDALILLDSVKYMLRSKSSVAEAYFDYYGTIEDIITNHDRTFRDLCRWEDMLAAYPYYLRFPIEDRDCIIVHAGYIEDLAPVRARYETVEEFYMYARAESINYGGVQNGLIIAGHTPTILKKMFAYRDGDVFRHYDEEKDCIFYDIDCGCAYYQVNPSGTMACIRLEDEEVFYL